MRLLKGHHHPNPDQEEKEEEEEGYNIYVLRKHTIPPKKNKN
ncbi:MAG: hypothetical protein ACHQ1D_08610 [Nitrososphaerales archaeon]